MGIRKNTVFPKKSSMPLFPIEKRFLEYIISSNYCERSLLAMVVGIDFLVHSQSPSGNSSRVVKGRRIIFADEFGQNGQTQTPVCKKQSTKTTEPHVGNVGETPVCMHSIKLGCVPSASNIWEGKTFWETRNACPLVFSNGIGGSYHLMHM